MAVNLNKQIKKIPGKPGVYLFKDRKRKILYIGKAASLKNRVKSHFQKTSEILVSRALDRVMNIDYIVTNSEIEALLLESELIKRYKPRYNEKWKDEKNFLYIKIDINQDYPRIFLVRRPLDDKALYFGPFVDAGSLKSSLKILRKIFPYRTCRRLLKKPCLQYHLKRCPGSCIGVISQKDYQKNIKQIILFLNDRQKRVISDLKLEMKKAAKNKNFEKAAVLRDRIKELKHLGKMIVFGKTESFKTKSDQALLQLKRKLNLDKIPLRIECYDISNIAGQEASGSMVVFISGLPAMQEYRKFKIKTIFKIDDYAMMEEILSRRFKRIKKGKNNITPDLIMVDGGKGQLASAYKVLGGYDLNIPAIGLAKRKEKVYKIKKDAKRCENRRFYKDFTKSKKMRKGAKIEDFTKILKSSKFEKVILDKDSESLHLLQRIRDEAHRFAIIYHRQLFSKKIRKSVLDEIYGLGPKRKKVLLTHFGSIEKIKKASQDELTKVIKNRKIACNIKENLQ